MFEDFTGYWIVTSHDGKLLKIAVVFRGLLRTLLGGSVVCISGSFTGSD
jgi:hypothetical protein